MAARALLGGSAAPVIMIVFLVPAAYLMIYGKDDEKSGVPAGSPNMPGVPCRLPLANARASEVLIPSRGGTIVKSKTRHPTGMAFAFILLAAATCCAQQPPMQLTLSQAQQIALKNNPQYGAAKFNAQAAAQVPVELRAGLQPTLYGSLTGVGADAGSRLAAGALNNPIVYNRLGTGLSVSQLITDFGRTRGLVDSANLRAQAQNQRTEITRATILLDTGRAYYSVLRAQAVLTVAQQTVKARQLIVDQVSALEKSKLRSQLDVSFAEVNLSDAKLLLASALNDLKAAKADLATAMGIPGQTEFALADEPLPASLPSDVSPLLQEAIQKRPELADLRYEQAAAEQFVKAERALSYPAIEAFGTAGIVPLGQAQIPQRYGAIGVNVNVPILNGGLFKARRTEAEFRAMEAERNLSDLQNQIGRDVRIAYLNATTAFERLDLTAQLLAQAKLALDLAQSRYDLGLSSIVELSQAQLNYTSAQIASSSARYDYQTRRATLDFSVGALR